MKNNLIEFTTEGLYCPQADVHIDPWKPVKKALITHAHGDHARWGSREYLAHHLSEHVLRYRLGQEINLQTIDYGQSIQINGVTITFYPAGHIIGSAQIKLTYKGESWVVSGDYKLEDDHISTPFEPVSCHAFITESTFGMPIYKWEPQEKVIEEINSWWQQNQSEGKSSLISAYSLGKAQRVIGNVDHRIGPILVHGSIANIHEALEKNGIKLPTIKRLTAETSKDEISKSLIVAPSSAFNSPWARKLRPSSNGVASGWMKVRGAKRRKAVDRGFVLSDHADWPGLNQAIMSTGAEKIYVTHGYTASFSRWLRDQGKEAYEVETLYEGELEDSAELTKE